jgi:hypothetical protein
VGKNLINDGNVYELLAQRGYEGFSDFNQNTGVLRSRKQLRKTTYEMPGGNTHPSNYADLFSAEFQSDFKDFVLSHDEIIIKSCYPNSDIKSDDELATIKKEYVSLTKYINQHRDKMLIIMTSPPLRPTSTTAENAKRAMQLAKWLDTQNFGMNVRVFDFFGRLADEDGYLKKEYRRFIWLDNHLNKRASTDIAPDLMSFIEAGSTST